MASTSDSYRPSDADLSAANFALHVRRMADYIRRQSPGIVTLAEATAEARRLVARGERAPW